jgi:hypothetical protein
MKICRRCQKTYTDDNLNFCLEDGSVLEQMAGGTQPATVLINPTQVTVPAQTIPSQQIPGQQFPAQYTQQPAWNTAQPQYAMQPKKSSKTWLWVVLILGVVVLACGGGLVGLILYGASQADIAANGTANTKGSPGPFDTSKPANKPANSSNLAPSSDRTDVRKLDLSKWVQKTTEYGPTEFVDGEFMMTSSKPRYYFVLTGLEEYSTVNADTSVTVRNVTNADTMLGYGLVFHSNPTPLQQGYAFLLDTRKQRYRVVHHSPQKENAVKDWTKSDAIKSGSDENTLEVRDKKDKIELYINGKMVTSITNVYGYPNGVVGLYAGDAIKIAFKNLEIRK